MLFSILGWVAGGFMVIDQLTLLSLPTFLIFILLVMFAFGFVATLILIIASFIDIDSFHTINEEIILTTESITISNETFEWKDIKGVHFKAPNTRGELHGRVVSDGMGNILDLTTNSKTVSVKFVIESKEMKENIKYLVQDLKKLGINILLDGIDLK